MSLEQQIAQAARMRKVGKCPRCNVRYQSCGLGIYKCPSCLDEVRDDFGVIREYLDRNRRATNIEIMQNTGIRLDVIDQFLKESKIELTDDARLFLKCEICGADIRSGRICNDCLGKKNAKMQGYNIADVGDKAKKQNKENTKGNGMHFLNRRG